MWNETHMTKELWPHHLTGCPSSAAFSLWKRETEMQGGNGLTEQKTLPPDDPMPAVTGCCLIVKELNVEGGMEDAWLCHPALLYLSMCFSGIDAL